MIYAALELPRDYHTQTETFGFFDRINIVGSLGQEITVSSGLYLAQDVPKLHPIVKLVEHHSKFDQQHHLNDIFIERYCYLKDGYLFPFKIKFLTSQKKNDSIVVLPRHMEEIHHRIQNFNQRLVTPASFYFSAIKPDYLLSQDEERMITELYDKNTTVIDNLCHDDDRWLDIYSEISNIQYKHLMPEFLYQDGNIIDESIRKHFDPKLPFLDSLTAKTMTTPLSLRELKYYMTGQKHSDVRQPPELEIKHPQCTQLSPKEQELTRVVVSEIGYTDLEIEYILSNSSVIERRLVFIYDRYNRSLDDTTELWLCNKAVTHCIRAMRDYTDSDRHMALSGDIRVVFKLTYNEEAIFEVYRLDDDEPIQVCHLDLALLSLCSKGVFTPLAS